MDWLRIGAFGLLIAYHVAMVFSAWSWVVKWPYTVPGLTVPMALLTPWRLPLLFLVSGFATRKLFARQRSIAAFASARSKRLLIPLAFGLAVLLPPELWVRARETGAPYSLLAYWFGDYWSPAPRYGMPFPAWEHLWFVVYLWTYTMLLTAFVAWRGTAPFDRLVAAVTTRDRLLWMPIALLALAKLALLFVVPERHGLFSDWAGHAEYVPMFLFGFALGGSASVWAHVNDHARRSATLLVAALSGAIVAVIELRYPGTIVPPHAIMAIERAMQVAMAWSVALLLLHVADRWLNRDHRWRATLAEAVFPAYLVHHPVLVVAAWSLLPLRLSASAGFAILLTTTAGACAIVYLLGREVRWLRPLIGLAPSPHATRDVTPVALPG